MCSQTLQFYWFHEAATSLITIASVEKNVKLPVNQSMQLPILEIHSIACTPYQIKSVGRLVLSHLTPPRLEKMH